MRILIIEDELPAARQLTKLIMQQRPNAQILETLDSVAAAVRWLQAFPEPDLIFMDIQIADGLSLDIFEQVSIGAPVIFTTAYDQYAVQAFKVNAIDYLLKPIPPEDLQRALERVEQRQSGNSNGYAHLSQYFKQENYKTRFLIKTGQHYTFLQIEDVAFFFSEDGLTQCSTLSGKKHFIDFTLDELERQLNPSHFFRISRGMLIRLESIQKIHPHLNGRLKLELQPIAQQDVFVSRDRVTEFKSWLGA
jgi:two-component system, LytTR family, response regulator LytT